MMKCKYFFKALAVKTKSLRAVDKKLAKSYVSLFLVFLLALTSTFAWFSKRNAAHLSTDLLEFQSASSLRINKDKTSSNKITIPAFSLDEASSVDGRNIYFPLGASFNGITNEMFFREGNTGDENVHYVYKNFKLKGTSGNTPVYIKSYKITVASPGGTISNDGVDGIFQDELKVVNDSNGKPDHQVLPPDHTAVRLAFIADSGVEPVVIDPSAQVVNYADYSDAVTLINENGVPDLEQTSPDSFSTYYYEHTPLFIIPGGETLNITLVIWLEGTMGNSDAYIGKEISVDIEIESNFAEMDTITFVDDSIGDTDSNVHYWVSNDNPIFACSYEDPYSDETPKRWKTVIMRKTKEKTSSHGAEWQAEIPRKAVTNISFYRLTHTNGSDQGTIYNGWYTRPNIMSMVNSGISSSWYTRNDLQETRQYLDTSTNTYENALVYTAIHGNGYSTTHTSSERLSPCIGYWNTSGGGSTTPTSATTPTGATSPTSAPTSPSSYNISLNVATSNQTWIDNNVQNSGSKLYFNTANGHEYRLNRLGQNSFNWSGSLESGDKITKMLIKNSSNSTYREWTASPPYTVTKNYTVNYYVNTDNNKIILQ